MDLLRDLLIILSVLASIFWWMQITFAYIENKKQLSIKIEEDLPPISVIIPVFNENTERIKQTVDSVLKQRGVVFDVIIVDDGSIVPVNLKGIKIVRTEKNNGKRSAQIIGMEYTKYDWIATVDSDTILAEDALANLLTMAKIKKLDSVTGSVFLSNENTNLLTKMTACMYWFSFYQERASQSFFGSVMCCSGALSIYKKNVVNMHKKEYLNQRFFGHLCTAGDDRHLTNLFLLSGHKVGWSANGKCWTHSPENMFPFLKQQLRWVRSHISSMYYIFSKIKKWNFIFSILTVKFVFRYTYLMLLYLSMLLSSFITLSFTPILITFISVFIVTLIKSVVVSFHSGRLKTFYLLAYTVFTFFVFNLVVFYGVFTPTKVGWLTRNKKSV